MADLLVEGQVLIELKVAQELRDAHFAFIRAHLCASVVTKEVMSVEVNEITRAIIVCAYAVSNALGVVFLERVYENALAHELRKGGLDVAQQHRMQVRYDGVVVGGLWQTCWLKGRS